MFGLDVGTIVALCFVAYVLAEIRAWLRRGREQG